VYTPSPDGDAIHPVRIIMFQRGITVRSCAHKLGLTENYLARALVGSIPASNQIRDGMAGILDMDAAELFNGPPPQPQHPIRSRRGRRTQAELLAAAREARP
jgi:hypothetical protein